MSERIPTEVFFGDERAFSDRGLAIYDPETCEVIQHMRPVPRGPIMDRIAGTFQGMSFGVFSGTPPKSMRLKYIDGKLYSLDDPFLSIFIEAPYTMSHPFRTDEMVMVAPVASEIGIRVTCQTKMGHIYNYKKDVMPVRIIPTSGRIKSPYISDLRGKRSTYFIPGDTPSRTLVRIKAQSTLLPSVEKELLIL